MSQKLSVLLSHQNTEWYTPSLNIEAARRVLGQIDLDPASSEQAQKTVKATNYFTIDDDGLNRDWCGRVYLNPPYSTTAGKSNQEIWSRKLSAEYEKGNVTAAILLVKSSLGYNWFEGVWDLYPVCFVRKLIKFTSSEGKTGPAKLGSAFFYLGPDVERFIEVFTEFGRIILPEGTRCVQKRKT